MQSIHISKSVATVEFQIKESNRQELAQQKEYLRYQAEQKLISKQQQILNQQPFVHNSEVKY